MPFALQFLVCLGYGYLFYSFVDLFFDKPLLEKVEVKERRFVPEQPRYPIRMGFYQPNTWTLKVTNEQGQGWVSVSQNLYDSVQIGDTIFVVGRKGRFTGRWILQVASKKSPKKRASKR